MHRFHVKERDTRDPHFLVFRDKLFVYTGTWYSGPTALSRSDYDLNKHLGYAAWSEDGVQCRNQARPGSRFCGVHDTDAFDDAEDLI